MKQLMLWILPVILGSVALEMFWAWRHNTGVYNAKETGANFFILLVNQLIKPLNTAWILMVLAWFSQFSLWKIPLNVGTVIVAVLVVDFLYYWQHRLLHEIRFLWTLHHVHHSSMWMNLTTSFRLNWMAGAIGPVFYIPAALLGFPIKAIVIFFAINLLVQFFLHTEAIDRVPLLEGWFNTPSAHRVHHGSNELYIDKNYGGILMVWDRLFGTYQEEEEKVVYGVTTGFQGHNPFKAEFGPMIEFLQGKFKREKQRIDAHAEGAPLVAAPKPESTSKAMNPKAKGLTETIATS